MNRAAHIENVFFRGLGMFPNKQFRGGQGGRKGAVCARAPCLRNCAGYIPTPCLLFCDLIWMLDKYIVFFKSHCVCLEAEVLEKYSIYIRLMRNGDRREI